MSPQVSYITIFIATLIAIVAKDTPNVNGHRLFNVSGIRQILILWARGFWFCGPKNSRLGRDDKRKVRGDWGQFVHQAGFFFAQSCTFCVVVTEEVKVSQTHTILYLNWRGQYYSEWTSLFCTWCNWNSVSKVQREPHSPSKVVSQLTLNWQKKN